MRTTMSLRVGSVVVVCALALAVASVARADISTERPGSILIFPKVIADGTRDTIIQITNTQPFVVHARCFYVDGGIDANTLQPRCQESDFSIWLTRQQPTHWSVSQGRPMDPSDNAAGTSGFPAGAGLDPGGVPRAVTGFTGALICAEVDAGDVPIANNALKGEATIKDLSTGDVTKYNGLAVKGLGPNSDNELSLDDVEYNACPSSLEYGLIGEGATDPVVAKFGVAGASTVRNFLTLIPCQTDLENLLSGTTPVHVVVTDEFEQALSATGLVVSCWNRISDGQLDSSVFSGVTRSTYLSARLTPLSQSGLLGVADSVVTDGNANSASAAINLHMSGDLTIDGPLGAPAASITMSAP